MSEHDRRQELREIFRQVVLTLGGIFSVYDADDELVWAVTRSLDQVFEAHLGPVASDVDDDFEAERLKRRPHPAVVELLASIDRLEPESRTSEARS